MWGPLGYVGLAGSCGAHWGLCLVFDISLLQHCKVRAFSIKDQASTTAFEIKFEESVIARDKLLESLK